MGISFCDEEAEGIQVKLLFEEAWREVHGDYSSGRSHSESGSCSGLDEPSSSSSSDSIQYGHESSQSGDPVESGSSSSNLSADGDESDSVDQ